jgi:hypothetical protein
VQPSVACRCHSGVVISVRSALIAALLLAAAGGCTSGSNSHQGTASPGPASDRGQTPVKTVTIVAVAHHHLGVGGPALSSSRARMLSPTRLAFVTSGSGSCPELPVRVRATGPQRLWFGLMPQPAMACTLDESTTTVVVTLNGPQLDLSKPLHVDLKYPPGGVVHLTASAA